MAMLERVMSLSSSNQGHNVVCLSVSLREVILEYDAFSFCVRVAFYVIHCAVCHV